MPAAYSNEYRVLSLSRNDAATVVMSNKAAKEIPLIDRSNFRDRLNAALQSNQGDVYAISVNDGQHELLYDFRVVAGVVHETPIASSADEGTIDVCNLFEIRLQYHTPRSVESRDAPLGDFVYGQPGPELNQSVAIELEKWASGKITEHTEKPAGTGPTVERYWRWIHLPGNNVRPREIFIHKADPPDFTDDIIRELRRNAMINCDWDTIKVQAFVDDSYHEIRGLAPHARLRRSLFIQSPASKNLEMFSLVIPYFDAEDLEDYLDRKNKTEGSYYGRQELERFYRGQGDSPENLHASCTLDQSYYLSLRDSTERDRAQVVVKYAIPKGAGARKKLLIVNQMWLWKVNSGKL
ncbi:hypothetical protein ABW19_dt0201812 [Dactylella cylindrospora]|nr:hypothetical protein ABW19_dt0201812 [Dactylella cylindrospora]